MARRLVLLAIALATSARAWADVTDRQSRVVPLGSDGHVRVEATIADVHITGWDRPEVAIEIVRRAPRTERLLQLPIDIDTSTPDTLHIRAVQAGDGRDPAVAAAITLKVPRTVHVDEIVVFEGTVLLEHLTGAVRANLARGPIVASDLSGHVRLETTIGRIDVKRADLRPDGFVKLRTFNGAVTLELARVPRDARITALALDGLISSDIPLRRQERWGPRFAETSLGRGEPVLAIETTAGDITITVRK